MIGLGVASVLDNAGWYGNQISRVDSTRHGPPTLEEESAAVEWGVSDAPVDFTWNVGRLHQADGNLLIVWEGVGSVVGVQMRWACPSALSLGHQSRAD